MNKTIIININGIVFHIEEDAYDVLRSYMIDVKKHFGHSADSHEIVGDIENRIAEMFNERIVTGKKEVITTRDVDDIIEQMGRVSEFDYDEAETNARNDNTSGTAYSNMSYEESFSSVPRKLFRDPDNRILGGVASGLGYYFGLGNGGRWLRLIFLILFLTGGAGLLIYLVLWIVVPLAKTRADRMAMRGEAPNLQNFKRSFDEEMEGVRANFTDADGNARTAVRSAGTIIEKILIVFVKFIAVMLIIGFCIGLIALLLNILTGFGLLGFGMSMGIFPMYAVDLEIREILLVSTLLVVAIPLIALIMLIIRIIFNRPFLGRYTGFTLLAVWLIAGGVSIYHVVGATKGYQQKSTLTDEKKLEPSPVYRLGVNDLTTIKLDDSLDKEQRSAYIQRAAVSRDFFNSGAHMRSSTRIAVTAVIHKIDSLEPPTITTEYSARGKSYEAAAKRAGKIVHGFHQDGERIEIDSHFSLGENEPWRDQHAIIHLNIPVGTIVYIHKDLNRILRRVPIQNCERNYSARDGYAPKETAWIMTNRGLQCMVDAPKTAEPGS